MGGAWPTLPEHGTFEAWGIVEHLPATAFQAGTSCAYCKDGLCQRMNQLMEDGHSQRKAAEIMAEESGGEWTANNIRQMFKNLMGKILPTPKKPEGGEGKDYCDFHEKRAVQFVRPCFFGGASELDPANSS